jgi:hypothetical protein
MRRPVVLALALFSGLAAPATASADTGSITGARDIAPYQAQATFSATKTGCGDPDFCYWYTAAFVQGPQACTDDGSVVFVKDANHPTTLSGTTTFTPAVEGTNRLCLYIYDISHQDGMLIAEATFDSLGPRPGDTYNCSDFPNQAAAQAYYNRYPGDPSRLDADGDGRACEANPCPCSWSVPAPAPSPPPAQHQPQQPPSARVPMLRKSTAIRRARQGLRASRERPRRITLRCRRASRTRFVCRAAWTEAGRRRRGTITVWNLRELDGTISWSHRLRLTRRR